MSVTTVFSALLAGIVVWFLVARRLTAKSWDSDERDGDVGAIRIAPSRIGLWMFMAIVTSLFGLFLSAYSMRMHHGDWSHIALPGTLWVNTLLLVAASIALQLARRAAGQGRSGGVRTGLLAGGALTFAFIGGQLVAWQQLADAGHFMQGSPAAAFFYMLTTVHGLHLLGGLWVWGRTTVRLLGGGALVDLKLSIELCSEYWHYLLLVWIVVFAALLYM